MVTLQDLLNRIRGNRIDPAAKRSELHQLQVGPTANEISRAVHPPMVRPLIDDGQGMLDAAQMAHRILRQHR
ncbi:hypothetical protein D3C81_950960 [compost metagenome]